MFLVLFFMLNSSAQAFNMEEYISNYTITDEHPSGVFRIYRDVYKQRNNKHIKLITGIQTSCMPNDILSSIPGAYNIGIEEDLKNKCPKGMLNIQDRYCIDKYEAALIYKDNTGITKKWSPFHHPPKEILDEIKAVSVQKTIPQGYIDYLSSKKACENSEKRLCTSDEWKFACRGSNKAQTEMFPHSGKLVSTWTRGICNDTRTARKDDNNRANVGYPVLELYPAQSTNKHLQDPCINQMEQTVLPNGTSYNYNYGDNKFYYDPDATQCISPTGAVDMSGSMHEWVSDISKTTGHGLFLGGYYADVYEGKLGGCEYYTGTHTPEHWDYSTGFRCCSDLK